VIKLSGAMRSWIADAIGPGSQILSVREMPRSSTEMQDVLVETAGGTEHRLVVRRYSDRTRLETDPFYDPHNEARALELLRDADVPAPRLYAADLEPTVFDVPTLLESWMPGEPPWTPSDEDAYLTSAAEMLVRIHELASVRPSGVPEYVSYTQGVALRPPAWSSDPGLWERVLGVLADGPPDAAMCFIHRDYHQGNTLAVEDRVVSVVDWPTAAWGPPGIDLARMRLNLLEEVGSDAASRFLEAYRDAGGDPQGRHPYWDLCDAADLLIDDAVALEGHERARFETWVARVLAEL
jgi:aminoglycoside phosphotransferase (APT) family kinase protein